MESNLQSLKVRINGKSPPVEMDIYIDQEIEGMESLKKRVQKTLSLKSAS